MCKGSTADSDSVCEGSNPSPAANSEIPITAPFPPCGENCAVMGISSLSAEIRFAGFSAELDEGCWQVRFAPCAEMRGVLNFLVFVSLPLFVSSFVVYAAYCAFTLEAFVPLGVAFGKACLPPIGWF